MVKSKTKILAIHLPQFHAIPENDEWWGEGFTEWTNVKRGKPLFKGHYQPREPLDDNYYDLSDLRVLENQIKLAKNSGIYGFCFYHYYFNGKTLLEKPIEQYRDYSSESFPYCLIWANQSWTRTWYRDNTGNSMLMQQIYGVESDWRNHFFYLLKFFKDDRYIKINNRPVYIIYIPQDIPCRRKMFSLWNSLAKQNGFDGLYLIAMDTYYGKDSNELLYDAIMNFEPSNILVNDYSNRRLIAEKRKKESISNKQFYVNNQYSYLYLSVQIMKKIIADKDDKSFYGIFSGWDNTARKDEDGTVVRHSTPFLFFLFLKCVLIISNRRNKEFVFINAWNEWSEGAYLEPDKKYKYGYLNAIKYAVRKNR